MSESNAAKWTENGVGAELVVGRLYRVSHVLKGLFTMVVKDFDDEWCTGEIVDGVALGKSASATRYGGEPVTLRKSFCVFTLLD